MDQNGASSSLMAHTSVPSVYNDCSIKANFAVLHNIYSIFCWLVFLGIPEVMHLTIYLLQSISV